MYSFLVNPASRSGRGQKYWERIKPVLEERKIPYQVFFSKGPGDMVKLSRQLTSSLSPEGEDVHLVVLGGDGTANEAVQGIADFSRTRFSYIPTGSSNDLARDAGISRNPLEALERILSSARERRMDVGFLHYNTAYLPEASQPADVPPDRRFLVSCGIGFDAGVCQEAMKSRMKDFLNKVGLGKLTYLGIALKQLMRSGRDSAELVIDENSPSAKSIRLPGLMFIACMSHCYEAAASTSAPVRMRRTACWICVLSAACPNGRCCLSFPPLFRESTIATMAWSVTAARPYISAPPLLYGSIPTAR